MKISTLHHYLRYQIPKLKLDLHHALESPAAMWIEPPFEPVPSPLDSPLLINTDPPALGRPPKATAKNIVKFSGSQHTN
jgi:hypothetical protein